MIGEGSSGGALALCVADKILMLENAVYSILSPEGFASILYKDASKQKEAAENMRLTAKDLKDFEVIDVIIDEPEGGAQKDFLAVAQTIKETIEKSLEELESKDVTIMLEERYQKFRKIGR